MEIELSGYVLVAYTVQGNDEKFVLMFDSIEFSSQDNESGFDHSSGEPVYRGVWNGAEENLLVQLTLAVTRDGITEKSWTINPFGDQILQNLQIAEDHIDARLVEG